MRVNGCSGNFRICVRRFLIRTCRRLIVQEPLSDYLPFAALRLSPSGGEPLNPEVVSKWTSTTGVPIVELYGQTETVLLCASFLNCQYKLGSMGKPPPGKYYASFGGLGSHGLIG